MGSRLVTKGMVNPSITAIDNTLMNTGGPK